MAQLKDGSTIGGKEIADKETLDAHKVDEAKHFVGGEKEALQSLFWQNRTDVLKEGNLMAGYYGKVNSLITGDELFAKTGLTAGTTVVSGDITWLKFGHNYKTLFVADRTLKHSISWDNIQAQNLVKGKAIEINGKYYLCRLMTGGNSNPASSGGGEWDDLIVRFAPNNEDSNWSDRRTICKEVHPVHIAHRVIRGDNSVSHFISVATDNSHSLYGYRPVLELL